MKKMTILAALLLAMLCVSTAWAEMGVQIIGGPAVETEPVSLDDFKLNADVKIDGYGVLCGTSFEVADKLGYYRQGRTELYYGDNLYYKTGREAEFVILRMDILNTTTNDKDYLGNCEVTVVCDDTYTYAGWCYQSNFDNKTNSYSEPDDKNQNTRWAINKADNFAIKPMYEGHYIFGCTLPNAIINSKLPLRMEIKIDDNEIVYHIRK